MVMTVVKARETWYNSPRLQVSAADLNAGLQKESPVIQRRTQTETYWHEQFGPTDQDVGHIYALILEQGKPVPIESLSLALIDLHCRQEERVIESELNRGPVYQPRDRYKVGQHIIFPALDYALGEVTGFRPGRNPDYGDFTVIQVQFEGEDDIHEFASELHGDHKLNLKEGEQDLLGVEGLLAPKELYEAYGPFIDEKLSASLAGRPEFVRFGDQWILRDLLVEISPGHLHLAEALIEIRSMPLATSEFLDDLDLPAEVSDEIQLLSLNSALEADPRFDNVGDGGRDIWYLRRLTPEAVVDPPRNLRLQVEPYDRQSIREELLLIEREIDDEGSGEEVMGLSRPLYRTTIALIYPHWRAGTLPLTVRTRGLFPESTNHHSPIVLVDGRTGDKMQGWVVHACSFVYGLEDWYRRYELPVGASIKLERTRDPRVITVDFEARRLKRLWVKTASIKEGRLVFHMRKTPISCEYDDQMTIGEDNKKEIDELITEIQDAGEGLLPIMIRVMPELTKLSPQGTVHAKTIYSAVNILRRTPPGPIFSVLSMEPCFIPMGGGYWAFDETLVRH
jgi:hypothetical protein